MLSRSVSMRYEGFRSHAHAAREHATRGWPGQRVVRAAQPQEAVEPASRGGPDNFRVVRVAQPPEAEDQAGLVRRVRPRPGTSGRFAPRTTRCPGPPASDRLLTLRESIPPAALGFEVGR